MLPASILIFSFAIVLAAFIIVSVRIFQVKPEFIKKVLKYSMIGVFVIAFSIISIMIGYRIEGRHYSSYRSSLKSVQGIWGGEIKQNSPSFQYKTIEIKNYSNTKTGKEESKKVVSWRDMGFESQEIQTKFKSSIRKKGLLKFPGYKINFAGKFKIKNFSGQKRFFNFQFTLPQWAGNISEIKVLIDKKNYTKDTNFANGIQWQNWLKPGESKLVEVSYSAQGSKSFYYLLGRKKISIRKLNFTLSTDYNDIRIPDYAMVPGIRQEIEGSSKYTWNAENIITGQNISFRFNIKANYGKIASKLFFYAPLAIALFMALLLVFSLAKEMKLHLMHYLFFLTGFFVFYLLNSYLLSFMQVFAAVTVSLVVSSGILIYYCILLKKDSLLLKGIIGSSLVFHWLFSFAFFFAEYTGLLITVGTIISLVALMKTTAKVDWKNKW